MKTAIAVPDAVFERVERRVKALGVSRSEFFSRAADRYLQELDREDLTARIDAAIAASGAQAVREQAEWADLGRASFAAATREDDW